MKFFFRMIMMVVITACVSFGEQASYKLETYKNESGVKDFINLSSIDFQGVKYNLFYSAVDVSDGVKHIVQEYVPNGKTVFDYDLMIAVRVTYVEEEGIEAINYAAGKINFIEQQQEFDPYATVIPYATPKEFALEYTLSDGYSESTKNNNKMIEWGLFRYINMKDQEGNAYNMDIQLAKHVYGDSEVKKIVTNQKIMSDKYILDFLNMSVPNITLPLERKWSEQYFKSMKTLK